MHPFHRLLVALTALFTLAGLVAACGGEAPTPAPVDVAMPTQAEMESETVTPTDQTIPTEPASPLPRTESPLPTPAEPPQDQADDQAASPVPTELPLPQPDVPPAGEVPQNLLDAVIEHLLGRLDVSREAIAVEKAEAVVWRDGSLGCPQPGMMYTQALVPGYQIVLRVGGETYDYHASQAGFFVLCEEGRSEEGLPPGEGGGPLPVVDE